MRAILIAAIIAVGGVATATAAPTTTSTAVRCHDAKGKFIKCPAPAKAKQCRDTKGKFIKC